MLTFCILTVIGSHNLTAYSALDTGIVLFEDGNHGDSAKWTIDENSNTGAFHICNVAYSDYCLGVAEGRPVQHREIVTLVKSDSANPIYWTFNRTDSGAIKPYSKDLYWDVLNVDEDYKPIRLLSSSYNPNLNYTNFRIELC